MSKQVLIEYLAFKPSPQSLNEAKMNPGKNLIVEGIVQRADAKNENGRVYPKAILHREVEKYIAGPIAQEILNTPSGNILRDLILNNITVGISSRGMGSVKQLGESTVEVQDDFDLVCWDFVSTPSTHGAYMKPVSLAEGKQYTQQNSNQYSKINSLITDIICNQTGVCCIK